MIDSDSTVLVDEVSNIECNNISGETIWPSNLYKSDSLICMIGVINIYLPVRVNMRVDKYEILFR